MRLLFWLPERSTRLMNSLESKDPKLPMKRQKGSEEKLPKLRLMRGKRQELSPRRKKERLTG